MRTPAKNAYENPNEKANIIPMILPMTEPPPFTAYIQITSFSTSLDTILNPKGKGIPMSRYKGDNKRTLYMIFVGMGFGIR